MWAMPPYNLEPIMWNQLMLIHTDLLTLIQQCQAAVLGLLIQLAYLTLVHAVSLTVHAEEAAPTQWDYTTEATGPPSAHK